MTCLLLCFPSGAAVDSQGVSSANVSAQIVFIVCGCIATVLVVIAVVCVAASTKVDNNCSLLSICLWFIGEKTVISEKYCVLGWCLNLIEFIEL